MGQTCTDSELTENAQNEVLLRSSEYAHTHTHRVVAIQAVKAVNKASASQDRDTRVH